MTRQPPPDPNFLQMLLQLLQMVGKGPGAGPAAGPGPQGRFADPTELLGR